MKIKNLEHKRVLLGDLPAGEAFRFGENHPVFMKAMVSPELTDLRDDRVYFIRLGDGMLMSGHAGASVIAVEAVVHVINHAEIIDGRADES